MMLLGHLLKAAVRAFFRIAFSSLLFFLIGAGASLFVAYQVTHLWPPSTPEYIIAGAIGLLLAYAAGLTVLLGEAVRGVRTAEREVVGEVEKVEQRL